MFISYIFFYFQPYLVNTPPRLPCVTYLIYVCIIHIRQWYAFRGFFFFLYNLFYVWLLSSNHMLTHWGRVTHICVSKLTIIGSDNGLAPGRRQTIIWTNDGTNFSEILIGIQTFSFKKMHLKMSSAKWRPFCLGLNVLTVVFCYHTGIALCT